MRGGLPRILFVRSEVSSLVLYKAVLGRPVKVCKQCRANYGHCVRVDHFLLCNDSRKWNILDLVTVHCKCIDIKTSLNCGVLCPGEHENCNPSTRPERTYPLSESAAQ